MTWDIPWDMVLYITVALLVITLAIDLWYPYFLREGFTGSGDNSFMTLYFPRRGDISFDAEEAGFVQDKRNVMGYADVQGLGVPHDFCRMLIPKGGDEDQKFFACALAGTENLSSTGFKTYKIKDGFKTSRDDYMRDVDKDGKADYCAIVKVNKAWESQCYRALETTFDTRTFTDTDPPKDIAEVLSFYEGIMFWFRFIDDMNDYGENLKIYAAGGIGMNESDVKVLPSQMMDGTTSLDDRIQITKGLQFNGSNHFLRLGDSPDMGFGQKISLITMRAISVWVKFDDFTNNAHILDFGNGAGQDNVFLGIIGKGDPSINTATLRNNPCDTDLNNVLPDFPSGAQPVPDVTPVQLMLSTRANVDEPCEAQVLLRKLPPLKPLQGDSEKNDSPSETATLLYEVWNGKLRMQHVKVQKAFKLKRWTHVCITTASGDGVRPALQIWINGEKMAEDSSAHLPQTSFTTNNYLGKSNWSDNSSQYENKAELFKGSLFDLRGYNQAINQDMLKKTIIWGKKRLGIK